jgi:hypothetical protein
MATIQVRRGTAATATSNNPTLAAGEIGWESDTNKIKIGDGATAWNSLAYFGTTGGLTSADIDTIAEFNAIVGDGNFATEVQVATKADAKIYPRATTGGHTLDATDLADLALGRSLWIVNSGGGDLTIPANATTAFVINSGIVLIGFENVVAAVGVTATPDSGALSLPSAGPVIIRKSATNTWNVHNGAPSVAASETVSGVVELATTAEALTGTDTTRAVTPAGVKAVGDTKLAHTNSAGALTDAGTIDLTATKHTLASSAASRTFTISYAGDDIVIAVTLSTTAATYTFPATALCVSEGIASGDNTLPLAGVSGDKYIITVKEIGSAYYVVSKNFGQ